MEQPSIVKKGLTDQREYKPFTLENKMHCLVISDPDTDISAACIDVNAGSLDDPNEHLGLAHFHEHMLFLGTKKYPVQNEFTNYLSKNSSNDNNAFTDYTHTNFYFNCSNEGFYGGLDRFAQFFIEPLFTESCTERELKAVNSEYELRINNDEWRKYTIFNLSAEESSRFSRFTIGSKESLSGNGLREKLLEFNKNYFSANLMKLVLYSNESVETQTKWIKDLFSAVPNKDVVRPIYPNPFPPQCLNRFCKIVPCQERNSIDVVWILKEPMLKHYKIKPEKYLAFLFGHEGPNSLLSLLIDEGLATALVAGGELEYDRFSSLRVSIKLTQKGLELYEDVLEWVFTYLNRLKKEGVNKAVWEEISIVERLNFDNKTIELPQNYCSDIAYGMQFYPPEDYLCGKYVVEIFDQVLLEETLQAIVPENTHIYLTSKNFEKDCELFEPNFKIKYSSSNIPEPLLNKMQNPTIKATISDKSLGFPPKNIFIPENTEVLLKSAAKGSLPKYPSLVYQTASSELFFKQDTYFGNSKAMINLRIFPTDSAFIDNPERNLCAKIWLAMFKNEAKEIIYQADCAEIKTKIKPGPNYINFKIEGFNDKMSVLLNEIWRILKNMTKSGIQRKFLICKEKLERKLSNFYKKDMYKILFEIFKLSNMNIGAFDHQILRDLLSSITYDTFRTFTETWLNQIFFEWFIIGNFRKEEAIQIVNNAESSCFSAEGMKVCPLGKDSLINLRSMIFPKDTTLIFEKLITEDVKEDELNSAIILYKQFEEAEPRKRVLLKLSQNIIDEPFFDQLRTNEQLGYHVSTWDFCNLGIYGHCSMIVSNVASCNKLVERMENFYETVKKDLEEMSDDEFEEIKEGVEGDLLKKPENLSEEFKYYMKEIEFRQYVFNRKEIDKDLLKKIKRKEVLDYYESNFEKLGRRLEIHLTSSQHLNENKQLLEDRKKNKKGIEYFNSLDDLKKLCSVGPEVYKKFCKN